MISMRAMGLENEIEDEFDHFQRLREKFEELVPSKELSEDKYGWAYGQYEYDEDEDDNFRNEDIDQSDRIEEVKNTLLELLESVYTLRGHMGTRATLMS